MLENLCVYVVWWSGRCEDVRVWEDKFRYQCAGVVLGGLCTVRAVRFCVAPGIFFLTHMFTSDLILH